MLVLRAKQDPLAQTIEKKSGDNEGGRDGYYSESLGCAEALKQRGIRRFTGGANRTTVSVCQIRVFSAEMSRIWNPLIPRKRG